MLCYVMLCYVMLLFAQTHKGTFVRLPYGDNVFDIGLSFGRLEIYLLIMTTTTVELTRRGQTTNEYLPNSLSSITT